jgi:putative DNA methylase
MVGAAASGGMPGRAVLITGGRPSSHPQKFPTEEAKEKERQRLFRIIEELVRWENSSNERVLEAAGEIRKATGDSPPPVLDPFVAVVPFRWRLNG